MSCQSIVIKRIYLCYFLRSCIKLNFLNLLRRYNKTYLFWAHGVYGFITLEQSGLMTLEHSPDKSYEVMLNALVVAIEHIKRS